MDEDFYLRDFMADVSRDFGPTPQSLSSLVTHNLNSQVRLYLDRSLHEPKYLDSPDYVRKGSDLLNRGRALLFEGYRDETQTVLDELQRVSNGFQEDEVTQEFGRTLKELVNNFFFDQWVEGDRSDWCVCDLIDIC